MQTKNLILLRGLPGSGKSTLAKLLSEENNYPAHSVDDFFTDAESGRYKFDFSQNHLAYKNCLEQTEKSMLINQPKIFVHNTFTISWEIEPYFLLAQKHNYRVFVITVENYHKNKNAHHISDEQIVKMAEKYKVKLF